MHASNNPSAIRSQREITQALLNLMRTEPYEEITVKQILLESKLARKTFYRNFDSKDDVLYSYINHCLHDYFDVVNNARADVLTTIFAFAAKYKNMLLVLDKNDMLHIMLRCMNEYSSTMLAQQNKCLNPFVRLFAGLESEYLVALNIGAIWNVIALWIKRGMKESPDEVRKTIEEYLKRIGQTVAFD